MLQSGLALITRVSEFLFQAHSLSGWSARTPGLGITAACSTLGAYVRTYRLLMPHARFPVLAFPYPRLCEKCGKVRSETERLYGGSLSLLSFVSSTVVSGFCLRCCYHFLNTDRDAVA